MAKRHKGWTILTVILLTVIAALGFGRFSFGAILPFMKESLALNYRLAGALGSAIFLGYLLSVMFVGYFVILFGARKVIVFSLLLTATGMALTGWTPSLAVAYGGCLITGIGTGGANIPAMGLLSRWFAPAKKGMVMGIVMSGSGFGIVFSGFVIPRLIALGQDSGWRNSLFLLAALTIAVALVNRLFLKNSPEELDLSPVGQTARAELAGDGTGQKTLDTGRKTARPEQTTGREERKTADSLPATRSGNSAVRSVYKNTQIWRMGFVYFLWGFSYLVFSTFLVDYLITELGYADRLAGSLFAVVGFASLPSGLIWGSLSDRLGRLPVLTVVLSIQALMLAILSFAAIPAVIGLAVAAYGLTLWGVPATMTAGIADIIEARYFTIAMGFVTIFFSVGQFISPYMTGLIIESTGQYFIAFLISALLSLTGACVAVVLHRTRRKTDGQQ